MIRRKQAVILDLNHLLSLGIKKQASLIHLEPFDDKILIRFRINSKLIEIGELDTVKLEDIRDELLSMAGLDIFDHKPQNGSVTTKIDKTKVRLDIQTLPVINGEKISIALLNLDQKLPNLSELGFWGQNLKLLKEVDSCSRGMIIVSGLDHSSKSKTLDNLLEKIAKENKSVSVIETKPNINLNKVNQLKHTVGSKVTISMMLEALIRQNTDAIAIDTIQSLKELKTLVEYSSKSRLVLATLYAKKASEVITKFERIGIEPFLTSSGLKYVIFQKQVKKLCDICRIEKLITKKKSDDILKELDLNENTLLDLIDNLEDQAIKTNLGIKDDKKSFNNHLISRLFEANKDGLCPKCQGTGYNGVTLISEVIKINPEIEKKILTLASEDELEKTFLKSNVIPLKVDALIKALRGEIAIDEVRNLK